MTKVFILGEHKPQDGKNIDFIRVMCVDERFVFAEGSPGGYKNVELICKNYASGEFDLMFAYDDDRDDGLLYLGYFNDGIV